LLTAYFPIVACFTKSTFHRSLRIDGAGTTPLLRPFQGRSRHAEELGALMLEVRKHRTARQRGIGGVLRAAVLENSALIARQISRTNWSAG